MEVDLGSPNRVDINLKGMVSYDKLSLINDMIRGTKTEFGKVPRKENLELDFDIIVDSTGFHRARKTFPDTSSTARPAH